MNTFNVPRTRDTPPPPPPAVRVMHEKLRPRALFYLLRIHFYSPIIIGIQRLSKLSKQNPQRESEKERERGSITFSLKCPFGRLFLLTLGGAAARADRGIEAVVK